MAKFYIQTDKGLIKVGNDITLENIKAALGYTPSNFSGDFYDLNNNPFSNGADGKFNIVDENQNIIAIVDKDGIHSVEMTAKDSYNRVHKLTEKADQSDVETKLDKTEFTDVITVENVETGEEFVIEDNKGNRGFILNKSGVKAKDFIISESVSLSNVDGRLSTIEGLLKEDGDDVINNLKNVIDYFNDVKEEEKGAALISDVASNKSKIDNIASTVSANTTAITNLSGVVSSNTTAITTNTSSIETLTSKVNKNTSDISSLKEIINTDEDGALYIVDKDNYIGLKLDETGLFVKDVTAKDENDKEHKLTEKADITYVDGKLNYKLNAEDFNNVIKVEGSTYSTITINEDGITSSGNVTANVSDVTHILSEKADKTYVDELDKKIPSVSSIDNEEINTIFDDIFK